MQTFNITKVLRVKFVKIKQKMCLALLDIHVYLKRVYFANFFANFFKKDAKTLKVECIMYIHKL